MIHTSVYIKCSYFRIPFFPPSHPDTFQCVQALFKKKKKDGHACKIFVCTFPPLYLTPPPPPPHTHTQVYRSMATLFTTRTQSEETSRHYGLLRVLKDNTCYYVAKQKQVINIRAIYSSAYISDPFRQQLSQNEILKMKYTCIMHQHSCTCSDMQASSMYLHNTGR